MPGVAGQGVGTIREIRPAAEVLRSITTAAEEIIERGILE